MSDTDTISDELRLLEECFKDRYTEADEKYMDEVSRGPSNPPVVYPWTCKFNQSFGRQMMFRGRGGQGHSRHPDRNRDRPRSGHQNLWRDGAPSWSQQGSSRPYYSDRERRSYQRY